MKDFLKFSGLAVIALIAVMYINSLKLPEQHFLILLGAVIFSIYIIQKKLKIKMTLLTSVSTYKCQFEKLIITNNAKSTDKGILIVTKQAISIPFPPSIGISIKSLFNQQDKMDKELGIEYVDGDNFYSGEIIEIIYDSFPDIFICRCKPIKMEKNMKLDQILDELYKYGWKLHPLEKIAPDKDLLEWIRKDEL